MTTSTQWQLGTNAAERYEQILVPAILGPAARALVDWAALPAGGAVLDVGCGTGAAARFAAEAVGPSGRVAGVDVNAGMLGVAQSLPPVAGARVEWIEASADALPVPDAHVDAVLCAQVLQFLKTPQAALSEMRRVLRPGGQALLSVWTPIHDNPYFDALARAVAAHIGPDTAAGLASAFRLSDAEVLRTLLEGAGWSRLDFTVHRLNLDLPPLRAFVPRHIGATPMAAGFHAAPEPARQAIVDEVVGRLAAFRNEKGARVPFGLYLAACTD